MENKFIRFIYTFFLGIILTLFVGLGINTFYPEPSYDASSDGYSYNSAAYNNYETNKETYRRNVSLITLAISIAFLAASLLLEKSNRVIANGILIGGVLLLLYSIGWSFATEDSIFSFAMVGVGLAVVLYLGHHRFTEKPKKVSAKKK